MTTRKSSKIISALLLMLTSFSVNANAELFDSRNGKWEFFLSPQLTNSKLLQFENGAEVDINKRSALGFGFGYNVNRHIELTLTFANSNGNFAGTRIIDDGSNTPEKFTSNLYTSSLNFGFTFNFLSGPFTPYVSANIGSTYIDSGVPTGNIESGYCWYPYYGYIPCASAQTYTSTEINYGAGAGLRYDFSRKLFIKGGAAINYLEFNSGNTPDFITYQFTFGFMF